MHTEREDIQRCFTDTLNKQVIVLRILLIEEHRQPYFQDFRDILMNVDTNGYYCDFCKSHTFCAMGNGQFLACAAYFSFINAEEETRKFYENYPLTEQSIAQLDRQGLLAVFYFQKYNIHTLTDYSMGNLRKILVEMSRENSPYRLTTH